MGLCTPAMLCYWLRDIVLRAHEGTVTPRCHGGIKLLDGAEGPLRPECLYIATPEAAAEAIRSGIPEEGVLLITGGGDGALEGLDLPDALTLIETGLPLLHLYNRVHEHVHRFMDWDAGLHQVVYTNGGLQELLQRASAELHATILLVNTGYKHIASVYSPTVQDPTAEELRSNGYQSFDTIQGIRRETPVRRGKRGEWVEYVSHCSNNYTVVQLICYQDNLAARLCVILNGPEPNHCYSDLSVILAGYVAEYMFSNQGADYGGNSDFGSLAADLIECRLTDPEELEQRLKQIKLAVRRYYHAMIVAFDMDPDRSSIPWNYIISQLEHIFPFSNITTYHGEILLIIRKMNRGSRLNFDRKGLLQILERYDGYASLGNTSEFLTSLPPIYHQARDALRMGRVMAPGERLFFYEDYSMYQIIELAAESARQNLGSRNPVHLCNNETIALVMYDKKTGGNLLEVLHTYLLHERNATETAKVLYIHRNTMLYKIRKIEEIIGCSLDDSNLRERLMFSYHVMEYMNRYCKEDILTLKRTRSEDYPSDSVR